MRFLTVCTANVCRSPMAAEFLQHHCNSLGIDADVRSAGTHAGIAASDPDAVAAMAQRGFDLSAHVPRPLTPALLAADGADLIVTMTRAHLRAAAVMGSGIIRRTFTAKELSRRVVGITNDIDIDGDAGVDVDRESGPTISGWLAVLSQGRALKNLMGEDPNDDVDDPFGVSLAAHQRTADELDLTMGNIAQSLALWMR